MTSPNQTVNLLIIDDKYQMRSDLSEIFSARVHSLVDAYNGDTALQAIKDADEDANPINTVISDYDFGLEDTRNGVEICTLLREVCAANTRFFLLSGLAREVPNWITYVSKGDLIALRDMILS
jgi:response regulator RpfG family c-di-GMP phosphodiesterase